MRITIFSGAGLLALIALSACATQNSLEEEASRTEQCDYPDTLTCDRMAGENYNCSCERGGKIGDILDKY